MLSGIGAACRRRAAVSADRHLTLQRRESRSPLHAPSRYITPTISRVLYKSSKIVLGVLLSVEEGWISER